MYHYTDVSNAINILNGGVLYSRAGAKARGLMVHENANLAIIAGTNQDHLDFVRLYFRPRTPTQYVNEGIKPPAERGSGHCPVPVFFVFDLVKVVGRDDARFSSGTLASYRHGHSDRRDYFMKTIPWRDVYGDGLPRSDVAKKARGAEVVIPGSLPIHPVLRGIFCRSLGERVTLMDGLADGVDAVWAKKIRTGFAGFFFGRYPYILNVSGRGRRLIDVEFSRKLVGRRGLVEVHVDGASRPKSWEGRFTDNTARKTFRLREPQDAVHVSVYMENCLAFRGRVILDDSPF
ncbi:DarT ssDNA thymidine ADP-ribosyltransferase family protein [Candidatus Palauibacter sp.]|uniref:DarT ssDNA thymidine ADP-ribosyltransferase family protein n=1 Tax=Candidatus Palauibacter sp. TaxID=3101350 RepID=UPI003B029CD5